MPDGFVPLLQPPDTPAISATLWFSVRGADVLVSEDPAVADPVCAKSPKRGLVDDAVLRAAQARPAGLKPLVFRDPKESFALSLPLAGNAADEPENASAVPSN